MDQVNVCDRFGSTSARCETVGLGRHWPKLKHQTANQLGACRESALKQGALIANTREPVGGVGLFI